jgi:acetyl-CoA C-acetyltransferase
MQAIDSAIKDINLGRHDIVLAGGTEAMSRAPLLFNKKMVNWFSGMFMCKSVLQKLAQLTKFRLSFLVPVIALLKGLTDHQACLSMGQTAEILAHRFDIDRLSMDEFARRSHQFATHAQDAKYFTELVSMFTNDGKIYDKDDGLRRDTTLEGLAKLRPYFDKKFGAVTAGNSAQITDGAAMLVLASEDAVKKHKLPVLGRIIDVKWAGVDPAQMGLGPVNAIAPLLLRHQLSVSDVDYWEINEAFAAQVLACLAALKDDQYCLENFGVDKAIGAIDPDRVNVDGGAIALGHPVGASGARIVLHLLQTLKRKQAKRGIASLCIGGGQGGAMLIEQVNGVGE